MTRRARLAAIGLLLAAAGCSAPQPRPAAPAPAAADARPATPVREPPPAPPVPPPVPQAQAAISPWPRIRARSALPGCDYRPEVLAWAKRYTASPGRFAATLEHAMPFLLVALAETERLHVPAEFALLPWVESHFRPVPGRGGTPAGMWQFMPATARGAGLVLNHGYDGRLDPFESTRAAIGLLAAYGERFGDWRLADIAFNAGEFRVRRVVDGRDTSAWPADRFARLGFSPISHTHLDKLLAISCVVAEPERFGVHLPEPRGRDRLASISLDAPLDLRAAARLLAIDEPELRRLNAGYAGGRMPDAGPWHLNLPRDRVAEFRTAIASIPPAQRRAWRERRIGEGIALDALARASGVPADILRRINGLAPDAHQVPAGSTILVPAGAGTTDRPDADARTYVVRHGDTLSAIARRFGIALHELLEWNGLSPAGILRPGDRLRIGALLAE